MTTTTRKPLGPMTPEEKLVHIPLPGAGTIPLCGRKPWFTVTDDDMGEVTCLDCIGEAIRLGMDEEVD